VFEGDVVIVSDEMRFHHSDRGNRYDRKDRLGDVEETLQWLYSFMRNRRRLWTLFR